MTKKMKKSGRRLRKCQYTQEMATKAYHQHQDSLEDKHFIGCNGRVNKRPDTCYSFWVGASLDVSQEAPLVTCFILTIADDWPG